MVDEKLIKKAANAHYNYIKNTYYKGKEMSELEVIDAFIEGAKFAFKHLN